MIAALELIGRRHPGETVAAVTHAVMIRLAVAWLHRIDDESWRIPVGRGSLTTFEIEDGAIRLSALPAGQDVD
jgi:broad specificity phosphatase PhoE